MPWISTFWGACPPPQDLPGKPKKGKKPGQPRLSPLPRTGSAPLAKFPLHHVTFHCFHVSGLSSRTLRAPGYWPRVFLPSSRRSRPRSSDGKTALGRATGGWGVRECPGDGDATKGRGRIPEIAAGEAGTLGSRGSGEGRQKGTWECWGHMGGPGEDMGCWGGRYPRPK